MRGLGVRQRRFWLMGLVLLMMAAMVTMLPAAAEAANPNRAPNCQARINLYINGDHSSVSTATYQARLAWLQNQCARNDIADQVAEDQGSLAPQVFPPGEFDRNGTPLACMDLRDGNFARHDNDPNVNPLLDPSWPGGMAPLNVPGDFMVANINGKAHFMVRNVVWAIEDTDGNILNPMLLKQETWFNQLGNQTHASIWFTEAYQPTSVWVEVMDEADMAYGYSGSFLPGRVTLSRTWFSKSGCHDKRGPTVIPQTMIDHAKSLGWLQGSATTSQSHYLTMQHTGDPNSPASWFVSDEIVANPVDVNWTLGHPWWISGTAAGPPPPPPPPPPPGDPVPPTVDIDQPADGATIDGIYRIDIDSADDTDTEASLIVEVSIDGGASWLPTNWNAAAGVHRYWWDTRDEPDGEYTVIARATDSDGLSTVSGAATVTCSNGNAGDPPPPPPPPGNQPPTVTVVQPAAGGTVDGIYRVDIDSADDADAEGALNVALSVDGGATWSTTYWNATAGVHRHWWDTRDLPDGQYTLIARATDTDGAATDSAPVLVTANNGNDGDPPPPPPPPDGGAPIGDFVYPSEGLTVTGIQRLDVAATDSEDTGGQLDVEFSPDAGATWIPMNWRSADGIHRYWWDTRDYSDGAYGLLARVTDTDGNVTTSAAYSMTVANNGGTPPPPPPPAPDPEGPDGAFVYPAEGLTVNKLQRIDVAATDDVDAGSALTVEFSTDDGVTWTEMYWNPNDAIHRYWWDTRNHPDGTYGLLVRVTDTDGNTFVAEPHTLHTNNGIQ